VETPHHCKTHKLLENQRCQPRTGVRLCELRGLLTVAILRFAAQSGGSSSTQRSAQATHDAASQAQGVQCVRAKWRRNACDLDK